MGQVIPVPRQRRWYHGITEAFAGKSAATTPAPAGSSPGRGPLIATIVLAVASGAMIGFGVPTGTGWAWKLGLGGVVLSVVLLFILTRSIERRLWAVFFTFMAGAAGSLAAPVYSFTAAARVGDPAAGTGAEGSGMMSSGGSIATTLLWFLGAVIAAWLARQERRK